MKPKQFSILSRFNEHAHKIAKKGSEQANAILFIMGIKFASKCILRVVIARFCFVISILPVEYVMQCSLSFFFVDTKPDSINDSLL
jgi:hypothetical protein